VSAPKTAAELSFDVYEKPLSLEEFEAQLQATLADANEQESTRELIEWFRRRYPTVEDRLRYVSRHARSQRRYAAKPVR
jgi:hypothetical protein